MKKNTVISNDRKVLMIRLCPHVSFLFLFLVLALCLPTSAAVAMECSDGNGFINQDANLRTGPGTQYTVHTPLLKGTAVHKKLRSKDWIKVDVVDSKLQGWVHFTLVSDRPCHNFPPEKQGKNPPTPIIISQQHKIPSHQTPQPAPMAQNSPANVTVSNRPVPAIGVIDIQRIINESIRGRKARERYEEERRHAQAGNVNEIDKAAEESISQIIVEIQAIVEAHAMQHGFTHVLNKNAGSIFYNDSSFNITNDIIQEYDRQVSLQQTP